MKDYTICAYMRLSSEDNDIFGRKVESGSITAQRQLILDYIKKQPEFDGCNVIERFDDGISGRDFETRPQFNEMIELAKKGKINCIIVKDCSRFGRSYIELGDYLEQIFPFLGVRFIAINDHYDSATCEGGLDIAFKNLVYDFYSRDASKKMYDTRKRLAEQGKFWSCRVLFGYRQKEGDVHSLEIDPETAPIVREVFDLKLSGLKNTEIAMRMNERGIKCPRVRKVARESGDWDASVVGDMLKNEDYTGAVVSHRHKGIPGTKRVVPRPKEEWIRVKGMHEPIVSEEEFQKVQDMIKRRKSTGKQVRKLHYRCGICGYKLGRNRFGSLYCHKGYSQGDDSECRRVRGKEQIYDEKVLGSLKESLIKVMEEAELELQSRYDEKSGESLIAGLEDKLSSAKKAKSILLKKLADRSIDREAFKEQKTVLDESIADLEKKIADERLAEKMLEESGSETRSKITAAKTFFELEKMTDEMWEKFVKDVYVYPGERLDIRWNFDMQDGVG